MKRFSSSKSGNERGFAMAALLIMLNVMAIALTMLLPAWQTMNTREREAELVFRGQQYTRAVAMYQRSRGAFPPSIDVLVTEKFLRKKYKDPMTGNGDFQIIVVGAPIPGGVTPPVVPGRGGTGAQPGRGGTGLGGGATSRGGASGFGQGGSGFAQGGSSAGSGFGQSGSAGTGPGAGTPAGTSSGAGGGTTATPSGFNRVTRETTGGTTGPVLGVVSKSTQTSLRLFNGRNKYSEWAFVATEANTQAGGVGGTATPGGRGVQAPGMGGRGGQQTPGLGRPGMGGPGMGGAGRGPGMGGAGMGPGMGGSGFGGRGTPQGSTAPPLQLPGGRGDR